MDRFTGRRKLRALPGRSALSVPAVAAQAAWSALPISHAVSRDSSVVGTSPSESYSDLEARFRRVESYVSGQDSVLWKGGTLFYRPHASSPLLKWYRHKSPRWVPLSRRAATEFIENLEKQQRKARGLNGLRDIPSNMNCPGWCVADRDQIPIAPFNDAQRRDYPLCLPAEEGKNLFERLSGFHSTYRLGCSEGCGCGMSGLGQDAPATPSFMDMALRTVNAIAPTLATAYATNVAARAATRVAQNQAAIQSISASVSQGAMTAAEQRAGQYWETAKPYVYAGAGLAALGLGYLLLKPSRR